MSETVHFPLIHWEEIGQILGKRKTACYNLIGLIRNLYPQSAALRNRSAVRTVDFADYEGIPLSDLHAFLSSFRNRSDSSA